MYLPVSTSSSVSHLFPDKGKLSTTSGRKTQKGGERNDMPSHKIQNKKIQNQKILKENLKENLLKWICKKCATNNPLDRKLLRKKALEISQSLDLTNFKCSEQWLTTFLKKYGFSATLTNCTGPCFKDYRLWIDLMRTVLTKYKYKDLFHVDELIMYSDILPLQLDSTLSENTQDSQVINAMNLISILFCCNASGTNKLPPLISGPYKSNILREDCKYYYSENPCISDEVFAEWLLSLNNLMVQQNRKILLLLHRHRIQTLENTQLSNVNLIFFPAEFPSHLKPLRRDVFHSAKMKYRQKYADKILKLESKWGLEEMIEAVLNSWSEVPRELIVSSFQRTTFRSDDSVLEISSDDWEKLRTGISFKRLVTFDDYLYDVPTSISNETKQPMTGKHNYNLRKSFQEVLQIEESDDIMKLKDTLKERYCSKSEVDLSKSIPREDTDGNETVESNSAEIVNLSQEKDSHQEESFSIDLDGEDTSKFCPVPSDLFAEKNVTNSLILVLRTPENADLAKEIQADGLNIPVDKNEDKIDCNQTQEGGDDKQIDQVELVNINADWDQSTTSPGKRNISALEDNGEYIPTKNPRTDDWSKQYETKYVFGPNQQHIPRPSTQHDECIVDSCLPKNSHRSKDDKPKGVEYIFTKNGNARDPSTSSKE